MYCSLSYFTILPLWIHFTCFCANRSGNGRTHCKTTLKKNKKGMVLAHSGHKLLPPLVWFHRSNGKKGCLQDAKHIYADKRACCISHHSVTRVEGIPGQAVAWGEDCKTSRRTCIHHVVASNYFGDCVLWSTRNYNEVIVLKLLFILWYFDASANEIKTTGVKYVAQGPKLALQ